MKPLAGLLLIVSGLILAIPQIYDVLTYIEMEGWPVVQGVLGVLCIGTGLLFVISRGGSHKKTLVEV